MIFFVVPCGDAKRPRRARASELYVGSFFRHALAAATAEADAVGGRVLIMSAKHGLVDLDQVLAPYDMKMGRTAAAQTKIGNVTSTRVTDQAEALGVTYGDEVFGMLPGPYLDVLDRALSIMDVYVQNVYEAAPGIGYQNGVCSSLLRTV